MRCVTVIIGIVATLAFTTTTNAGSIEDKAHGTDSAAESTRGVDVAIDISEKTFHIIKGGTERGFTLLAGSPTVIQLRNRDLVAHEFVSTLFHDVPFRISGTATLVKTARASGVRLDPGQIVTLEFSAPLAKEDQYGAVDSSYDVFWCNVHGKDHGHKMRGELLILETRGEIGGG